MTPAGIANRPRLTAWILATVLTFAVVATYANCFRVPFILDDASAIERNSTLDHLGTAFRPPARTTMSGRPITNASFAVNRAATGGALWGYHLGNLAIHVAAALALFALVGRTLRRLHIGAGRQGAAIFAAFAVALLWALHPLQTESVTYLCQRAESLAGLFGLLTMYAMIRAADASSRSIVAWLVISVLACALGMASKETMAGIPLLVVLYDRTFVSGSFAAAWRARRWYYAGLAATWVILLLCALQTGGRGTSAGIGEGMDSWTYLLTQSYAILHYLRLVVWPSGLTFDYGFWTVAGIGAVAGQFTTLVLLFVLTVWAIAYRPVWGFLGAWFFITLAPSSSVVPVLSQTMAEHRMYLALAAPITAAALWLMVELSRRGWCIALGAALALGCITWSRNEVYRANETLWRDTIAKRPDNPRAYDNLAEAYSAHGRWADAIELCRRRLMINSSYPGGVHAIFGRALLELRQPAAAIPELELAVRQFPDEFDQRSNYGAALAELGRWDDASVQYHEALRLNPMAAGTHFNLGNLLAKSGRFDESVVQFGAAVKLKPDFADAEAHWAMALEQAGRVDEAIPHFDRVLALRPGFAAEADLARALAKAQRWPEAVRHYETAVRLDPNSAEAQHNLAVVLMEVGRVADALSHFEQSVQLAPGSAEAHHEFAVALGQAGRVADARAQEQIALRIQPDFAEAREYLASLPATP